MYKNMERQGLICTKILKADTAMTHQILISIMPDPFDLINMKLPHRVLGHYGMEDGRIPLIYGIRIGVMSVLRII